MQWEMGLLSKRTLKLGAVPCVNRNDMSFDNHKEKSEQHNNKRLVAQLLTKAETNRPNRRSKTRACTTSIPEPRRADESHKSLEIVPTFVEEVSEDREKTRRNTKVASKIIPAIQTNNLQEAEINPLEEMPLDVAIDDDMCEFNSVSVADWADSPQQLKEGEIKEADPNIIEFHALNSDKDPSEQKLFENNYPKRSKTSSVYGNNRNINNVDKCRTCDRYFVADAETKDLLHETNRVLLYNIKTITGITLRLLEGLPHYICSGCLLDLGRAIAFRENCIRTEGTLRLQSAHLQNSQSTEVVRETSNDDSKEFFKIGVEDSAEVYSDGVSDYANDSDNSCGIEVEHTVKQENAPTKKVQSGHIDDPLGMGLDEQHLKRNVCTDNDSNKIVEKVHQEKRRKIEGKRRRLQNQKTQKIVCDICGYVTKRNDNFKMHMLRHTGSKDYQCPECPEKFYNNYLVQLHIRTIHKNEKPFKCRYCEKVFTQAGSRNYHEKMLHPTKHLADELPSEPPESQVQLPFCCIYCAKSFDTEYALEHHVKLHNTETPFKCNYCEQRFASHIDANKHELTHNEKPFVCNICSKGFSYKARLEYHMTMHSGDRPYKCETCNVAFRRPNNLATHNLSVTHERNLKKTASDCPEVT
ncbi:zinc finger protein 37-like [Scaptodrosophila lebanonensis]|uniref:Zinc finger protein 37-like n=1 Tax=Drosophila lebanonensis TaxID=7225 RepID=A0A6J2TN94_DROLE|nr:zinc finger protein 37-like [Scaptodrosophila lebanonensis]